MNSINSNQTNSLANLAKWQQTQTPAKPVSYEAALGRFQEDVCALLRLDRYENKPIPPEPTAQGKMDSDDRPWQVEVEGLGSFHESEESFTVKRQEKLTTAGGELQEVRHYGVHRDSGKIDVVNYLQPTGKHKSSDAPEGYESYLIDPSQGLILNYHKEVFFSINL